MPRGLPNAADKKYHSDKKTQKKTETNDDNNGNTTDFPCLL